MSSSSEPPLDDDSLPTSNVGIGTFFDATHNGGGTPLPLDMFFATFSNQLDDFLFGTYIGGAENDYLGDTGDPRGANHLFANSGNLWLGTTTHSGNGSAISPTSVGLTGFDPDKTPPDSNTSDVHLIFRLGGVGTTVLSRRSSGRFGPDHRLPPESDRWHFTASGNASSWDRAVLRSIGPHWPANDFVVGGISSLAFYGVNEDDPAVNGYAQAQDRRSA